MQSFDGAASAVATASTPAAPDTVTTGPPPADQAAQGQPASSLVEAQVAVLAAHNAVQVNMATIRAAHEAYAQSISILSGG